MTRFVSLFLKAYANDAPTSSEIYNREEYE